MKLYRGYNKDYSNWGIRLNQNYIWTTDDIDYALEYAKLFDNGGLVEFDVDENQLNLANDYDGEELFGDEWYDFGGLIDADNDMIQVFIDNGFNSALLDNSGIDCYLLFNKKLIKSVKELPIEYDENAINEVLKIAGVQINESKYTVKGVTFYEDPSIKWIKTQLNNGKELRVAIDGDLNEPYFGQWLVWNALDANHQKAFQILGMDEDDNICLRLSKDAITYWGYYNHQINNLSQSEKIQKIYPNGYKLIKEW